MPITDNIIMRIFAAYIGAPVSIDIDGYEEYQVAANDRLTATMVGISEDQLELRNDKLEFNDYVDFSRCILLLRPISSLTDEECIEVARVNGYVDNGAMQREYLINKGRYLSINSCLAVTIDYLRSINIITTVHGIDLVKEGIAIVDETKTTNP